MTMNRLYTVVFSLLMLSGCSAVDYSVSEKFADVKPYTIVVMPIDWTGAGEPKAAGKDVTRLFKSMAIEALKSKRYNVSTDETLPGAAVKKPAEAAKAAGADAALVIRMNEWDASEVLSYASLNIRATIEMHSKDGELLWRVEYATSESDAGLDASTVEAGVIKTYEPRVQRFVDAAFSTLPQAALPDKRGRFFEWLP